MAEDGFLSERLASQAATEHLSATPPFPRSLMLELSNACNHTCSFCYNPAMSRQRKTMDPAFTAQVLADAYALGAREVAFATTGEPLANRRLLDYVAHAKQLGYEYTYFSTNGALLDADKVERIFEVGLDSIKFSINAGTAPTYARIHGEDAFSHVIGMVHLIARRRRELGSPLKLLVTSIVTKGNEHEKDELRSALGGVVDDLEFFDETKAVGPTNGTLAPLPCAMVFDRVHVTCEGYLTACCVDYENNLITADLATTSLADAWHSAAFQALRQRHLDKKLKNTLCQVCVSRKMAPYLPLTDIGREGDEVLLPQVAPEPARDASGNVLVILSTSVGEVDWILPVLHRLHERSPDTKIIAVVEEPQLQDKLAASEFLSSRLAAVAAVLHHGRDRLTDHCDPARVGLLLKTDDPDTDFSRYCRRLCPEAKVAVFPSGTALLTRADDPDSLIDTYYQSLVPIAGQDLRVGYEACDLVLAGTPHMEPFYRNVARAEHIHTGGVPRYDAWWIAEQNAAAADPREAAFLSRHRHNVLFIIRGPHWLYQADDDYNALMGDFLARIRQRPELGALIKPHPRQDPQEVETLVRAHGGPNVMLSARPLQQLAGAVDLVVSMFSSGVLDALSVGTPVVEFYRYHDRQPVLEFRRTEDGRMVSLYEALGLVQNLDSARHLAQIFDSLGTDAAPTITPAQREAFQSACAVGDDSAGAAASALLELLARAGRKELVHA